jgi:hypothetical protein
MKYKEGFKYQLHEDEVFYHTGIEPVQTIKTRFIELTPEGKLTVFAGYAWDGPSGPTYDSLNSMRASLAHDAIYQLMRMGLLEGVWRYYADILLDRVLEEDGMWKLRRWYWMRGVQWFAGGAADPDNAKPILEAP